MGRGPTPVTPPVSLARATKSPSHDCGITSYMQFRIHINLAHLGN
jgi:hypothetical protein